MSSDRPTELLPLRVEQVVYPGQSLGHDHGKIVFTNEGLPGELIEVRTIKERSGYIQARTERILEASARRREPRCDHYQACSPYQVMDYALQLELKKSQVTDILGRQFGIDPDPVSVKPSPETWGYRTRARFHCPGVEGALSPAYHRPGALRSWIPVKECSLISARMNALLAAAVERLNAVRTTEVSDIEVRETASGDEALLVLFGEKLRPGSLPPDFGPEIAKHFPLAGLVALRPSRRRVAETTLYGRNFLEHRIGGLAYRCGARSFFQVNRFLLDAVVEEVRATALEARPERAVDLYSGVGTFGLALAAAAGEAQGIESDPANTGFLAQNIASNGIRNFTLLRGTAEEWIERALAGAPDLVMVDPPRKGLGPGITGPILEAPPSLILYLSCDPATLGRDLKALAPRYRLRRLTVFDFFPHTPHIETLSILDRT